MDVQSRELRRFGILARLRRDCEVIEIVGRGGPIGYSLEELAIRPAGAARMQTFEVASGKTSRTCQQPDSLGLAAVA